MPPVVHGLAVIMIPDMAPIHRVVGRQTSDPAHARTRHGVSSTVKVHDPVSLLLPRSG